MSKGQPLIYIDTKGEEIYAQEVSRRYVPVEKDGKVIREDLLVSLQHPGPTPGQPITLHDLVHFTHPSKDEANPELPRIALHCWKYPGETHEQPAKDHPIHDKPFELPQKDKMGNVIPKARPQHEAHIARHQAEAGIERPTSALLEADRDKPVAVSQFAEVPNAEEHNPGNPKTVSYRTKCTLCLGDIIRVAHHQGGQEFDREPDAAGNWVKHSTTCKGIPPQQPAVEQAPQAPAPPAPEEHPLVAVEGEITIDVLTKVFGVISVLYDPPDPGTYKGVEVKLPNGNSQIFKANGFDLDIEDAYNFPRVNGYRGYVQTASVKQFEDDRNAKAAQDKEAAERREAGAVARVAPEPGVIAQLEEDVKHQPPTQGDEQKN
jgi:hypothetical protein